MASVSTDLVLLVRSSAFNRTRIPAAGEYTRTLICVALAVKGIFEINPAPIVVPAHVSAPFGFVVRFTLFAALTGSTAFTD